MVSISRSLRLALLGLTAFLFVCSNAYAQTAENTTYIGLGAGSLVFMGDVSSGNSGYSPWQGRPAYHFSLSNQLNPYLHGGLEAMFGTVGANERTSGRNLNFSSEIRSGGLFLGYNFNHVLSSDRVVTPILSVGVSGFEFLSKSDLFDAEGRRYHYWDDGTIRDIAQSAGNAADAVLLNRDYTYESDLRELDIDGFGDYNERALMFPIGLGAEIDMGTYLKLNIHTRYYLTTTDYVDNVTGESLGSRAGNASNDGMLYTGFVLRYGLHKKLDIPDGIDPELYANLSEKTDQDGDGVLDIVDKCPDTPAGEQVDANGCANDSDGDGVPDYMDLEMDTPEGEYVNEDGVAKTDEEFEEEYLRYLGQAEANRVEGTIESADIPDFVFTQRPGGKKYMVQVDETTEGISAELASLLLSIPDVQTVTKGDTTLYMVGDYDNLPDAVRRQLTLQEQGIEGEIVSSEDGMVESEETEAKTIRKELEASGVSINEDPYSDTEMIWRVQVGAFKYNLNYDVFGPIPDVIRIEGDDKLTRYFSGVFNGREDAATYRDILQNSGYTDAFIVAFQDGERIIVRNAKSDVNPQSSEELWERPSPDAFDESLIDYKIKLVQSDGSIPTSKIEQLREVGSVEQMTDNEGTIYLTGGFEGRNDAESKLKELVDSGLTGATVVGVFNGEVLELEEVEKMILNK